MKTVDVCLSPELLHLYKVEGKNVVVVDILRATSCMTTAIAHEVAAIIPVAELEECKALQGTGLLAAAERDGKKVDGFDLDNSPFSYMDEKLKGKEIAVTTTNGTLAITKSANAHEVLIGSFLNIHFLSSYLSKSDKDLIILCAGWKGKVNLEDTLFAGALINKIQGDYAHADDSSLMAEDLYLSAKHDMLSFVSKSSHVQRLKNLNITKDIKFCLTPDVYNVIPVLKEGKLVKKSF